jgi:hypothetical protein
MRGDFDGDGKADLTVCRPHTPASTRFGRGTAAAPEDLAE